MSSIQEQRKKADEELGITASFEAATAARSQLDWALEAIAHVRLGRRDLERHIENRETDITQETWAENSDLPVTRLDKLVKVNIQSDPLMRSLRKQMDELATDLDNHERVKAIAEADIRIHSARMIELQGYLNFTVALMQNKK